MTDPLTRRAIRDLLSTYAGPFCRHRDVTTRRRRLAALLRGTRRGWMPKMGLYRARRYGPAFRAERIDRVGAAVMRAIADGRLRR